MPFILVRSEGRYMDTEEAKRLGLKGHRFKPGELTPGTKAYAEHERALARTKHSSASTPAPAARPLPPAPLAGFIEPKFMSSHEKAAETTKLQSWVKQARKREDLTSHQKRDMEVLTDRLRYIERGFR